MDCSAWDEAACSVFWLHRNQIEHIFHKTVSHRGFSIFDFSSEIDGDVRIGVLRHVNEVLICGASLVAGRTIGLSFDGARGRAERGEYPCRPHTVRVKSPLNSSQPGLVCKSLYGWQYHRPQSTSWDGLPSFELSPMVKVPFPYRLTDFK